MKIEGLSVHEKKDTVENQESDLEKSPELLLNKLEDNTVEESNLLNEAKEKIQKSDANFQQETATTGILNSLGEKVEKNKLLRAALVGLSLCNVNPALASGLEGVLNATESASILKSSQENNLNLSMLPNLSESHTKELQQVYAKALEKTKGIIVDELENGTNLNSEAPLNSNSADPKLLILQQQILDLQNSGEMSPRRKGGVLLPFDSEHSQKTNNVEYSNSEIAENAGKQRITIENANEDQIRAWINYLKNPTDHLE